MLCPGCDGFGYVGLWTGYGGNEHLSGDTERCTDCGGDGEVFEEEE